LDSAQVFKTDFYLWTGELILMNKRGIMWSAMAIVAVAALAASALAEAAPQDRDRVARGLADLKRTAFQMRSEADTLNSFTPNKQLSWQSHRNRLHAIKEHVNDMGQSLVELEAMKPMASQTQLLAIEHARPHLTSVARNLTGAIELMNENRQNVYWSDYGEAVTDVYSHADALHSKLDAILDYEKAKDRLGNMELLPEQAGQS
jgi:hypothetical protein